MCVKPMNDPSQISRDFRLAKGSFWKKLIQAEVATEAKRSMLKLQKWVGKYRSALL